MDLHTFLRHVEAMSSLAPEVRDYAASVGRQGDDAARRALAERLAPFDARAAALDERRAANCRTATEAIDELIHAGLLVIRNAAEADDARDDQASLASMERQLDS